MIVKPAYDDASGGIDSGSVVRDRKALDARIAKLHTENKMAALVEEYIEGREIHCAILGDEPLPLYEMVFKGGLDDDGKPLPRIITYRAKWDPYSRDHHAVEGKCPAEGLSPELVKLSSRSLSAYRALGCRDYARVGMRVDPQGNVYVLESSEPIRRVLRVRGIGARKRHELRADDCKIIEVAIERNRMAAPGSICCSTSIARSTRFPEDCAGQRGRTQSPARTRSRRSQSRPGPRGSIACDCRPRAGCAQRRASCDRPSR
jgi:hypothetical protein